MTSTLAWVFMGLVGSGLTYLTLTSDDNRLVMITGMAGAITWFLFAFYALDVGTYDQTGTLHTDAFPAFAVWGIMLAVPNLYIAYYGPLAAAREKLSEREVL